MTGLDGKQALTVVERELRTVGRNRALLGLVLGVGAVIVGVARLRGAGFVPLALDLVTVLEFLIPVLAFAFGYRALLDDAVRGELDMLRTCPISRSTLVVGVFLGRAIPLLIGVLVSLLIAGAVVVAVGGPTSTVLATHGGADSPILFLRFVVLSAAFALVALAVALAVSTVAGSPRQALALGGFLLVALVIGLDLGLVVGLAGGLIPESVLEVLLAASPNSAYRGLVLDTVVGPVATADVRVANAPASVVGLATWFVGSLVVAIRSVWET